MRSFAAYEVALRQVDGNSSQFPPHLYSRVRPFCRIPTSCWVPSGCVRFPSDSRLIAATFRAYENREWRASKYVMNIINTGQLCGITSSQAPTARSTPDMSSGAVLAFLLPKSWNKVHWTAFEAFLVGSLTISGFLHFTSHLLKSPLLVIDQVKC